jgi:hypothetical protein
MRWDRLWKVTDAEGKGTTTGYYPYPDGKVWKVIDAKGNNAVVNRYYYDDVSLKEVGRTGRCQVLFGDGGRLGLMIYDWLL